MNPFTMETLLKTASCLFASYVISIAIYRLFFHPLSHVPGPILAKLSDGYAGYHALRRSLHVRTYLDHQKYGNIMRYGPNRIVFNSAQALSDIYQSSRVTKSSLYSLTAVDGATFIFNAVDPELHARKRKIVGPALSDKSTRLFEPTVLDHIDQFIEQIRLRGEKPVNLTLLCKRLAMDVAGHLGFGYPLGLQTTDNNQFVLGGISLANHRINTYMNFPSLTRLNLDYLFKMSPLRNKWRHLIGQMVAARLAQDQHAIHDFYSFVADSLDNNTTDIKDSELFGESIFFMSAAGDTVSCGIAALFFYLSRYPECYNRLAREIRTTFGAADDIRGGSKLSGCRYLRACIDEALRMSPPIAGTLWRQAIGDKYNNETLIVDGKAIPRGTHIGVNTYSIHHNDDYYTDPFTFRPERWLSRLGHESEAHDIPKPFVPFSVGARSCVGKPLAYLESSLVMAKTLWHFDFEIPKGHLGKVGGGNEHLGAGRAHKDEFQVYDILTARHDGPYLVFKPWS